MKERKEFIKIVTPGIRQIFILSSLVLFYACGMQDKDPVNPQTLPGENFSAMHARVIPIETPLVFNSGFTRYYAYSVLEKGFIKAPEEGGPNATAILTHVNGHDYELVVTETVPFPPFFTYRIMELDVKITPSGEVMFSWPQTWLEINSFADPTLTPHSGIVDQVLLHMGCTINGPGINKGTLNYRGTFDGERLIAISHFMGEMVQPGTFLPWFAEIVEGPIKIEFLLDLSVDVPD